MQTTNGNQLFSMLLLLVYRLIVFWLDFFVVNILSGSRYLSKHLQNDLQNFSKCIDFI